MNCVANVVRDVLTPELGASLADMTVRATAISLGKSAEDLNRFDLPALMDRARQMMSGVATHARIEATLDQIREKATCL